MNCSVKTNRKSNIEGMIMRGMSMNRLVRNIVLAIPAVVLLTVTSTTCYAWDYYVGLEDDSLEEVAMEREILSPGTIVSYLPNGARSVIIDRTQYFVSGSNWFVPVIKEKGVSYQVVFAPV
jgi:hypothetical protein